MNKRFPGTLDMRAVALLISYDGRMPRKKLTSMVRRCGVVGPVIRADGSTNGSRAGFVAARCARYLREQGLIVVDGDDYVATVDLSRLATWLADALLDRERHLRSKQETSTCYCEDPGGRDYGHPRGTGLVCGQESATPGTTYRPLPIHERREG